MIDSHCHIDFADFDDRRGEVIAEARRVGVHTLINIGVDLTTSERSVALAEQYEMIHAAVGVHPHDARTLDDQTLEKIRQLAAHPKVIAIGEIGLDFYRDLSPRRVQKIAFHRQMQLAVELNLPVVIHTRNAFEETCLIVGEYSDLLPGGVFHCFPGSEQDAARVFELGFVVGVGGVVTYPNSQLGRVAVSIPLERIILETDAPYLAPVPYRGRTNQPAYVRFVRDKLAELRGQSAGEIEKVTDRTGRKLFGLVETFGG